MQKDMARARLGECECECERECRRAVCSCQVDLNPGTSLSSIQNVMSRPPGRKPNDSPYPLTSSMRQRPSPSRRLRAPLPCQRMYIIFDPPAPYPASRIPHPASCILHPASPYLHPASRIPHRSPNHSQHHRRSRPHFSWPFSRYVYRARHAR
jgi:hypothetical protein